MAKLPDDKYKRILEQNRKRLERLSKSARDISYDFPPTDLIDWDRRNECWDNLRLFLETYFPNSFNKPWSNDHLRFIEKLEQAIKFGGQFAMAAPRGTGKSTLTICSTIWAILTGKRQFICLIGATQEAAERLLTHIKTELQFNLLLLQDFPTACFPVVQLEGKPNKANGQLYEGKQTLIHWSAAKLVMPTIDREDATCNGSIITACGLTGHIRGQNHIQPDGNIIRPSLVILDDPQTRESAASAAQTRRRLEILMGDVMGMAGPGETLTCIIPCTVIYKEDFADQILDIAKHPEFKGERTKLLYSFPSEKSAKHWDKYKLLQDESYRNGGNGEEATEYYKVNQEPMDEGAEAAWKERFNEYELSAIQHAMNLFYRDEAAFYSEYQNEPAYSAGDEQELPKPKTICEKTSGYKKGLVPTGCEYLTAFIDVQQSLLYYTVVAWERDFTGYVIDYGTYPDQRRSYFTLQQAKKTLQTEMPRAGLDGQIYFGLEKTTKLLLDDKKYLEDGGVQKHIDRLLIDANWGLSTNTIYKFCRESRHTRILMPAHGRFVGATSKPYSEYRKVRGDINGHHWRIPKASRGKVRHILMDGNYWKSYLFDALNIPKGDKGCLTLYGDKPSAHRMLADQLCSESIVRVQAYDRTVDEWKLKPHKPDNHFFDCLYGCFVAASLCGCASTPSPIPRDTSNDTKNKPKKNRVSYINL